MTNRYFSISLALIFLSPFISVNMAYAKSKSHHCVGYLYNDSELGPRLAQDRRGSTFVSSNCDASLDDMLPETARARRSVLRTCTFGELCEIYGTIEGHGTFAWTSVRRVRRLGR